jgi:hypothetical protein
MLDISLPVLVCQSNHSVGHAPVVTELIPAHKIGFELDVVKSDILQIALNLSLAVKSRAIYIVSNTRV